MQAAFYQQLGPLGITNFLKYAIELSVQRGIPANQIGYLLLLPLVACFIAIARYVVGLRGFGIFTPVMLAVVFLIMGLIPGVSLFIMIVVVATMARIIMRKIKIHYLARMALVIWVVCLAVFFAMYLFEISILPVMLLILLAENFVEAQISQSPNRAVQLTAETFVMALGCFGLMSWSLLHKWATAEPEILLVVTVILNLLVGRFTGMRILEYQRFRRLLK